MLFFLLVVLFYLVIFSCVILTLYQFAKITGYRAALQAWLVCFYCECAVLLLVPKVHLSAYGGQDMEGGYGYMMGMTSQPVTVIRSIFQGKGNDFLALLLLPVIPALFAQRASLKNQPPKGQ